MFVLDEPHCRALERELTQLVESGPALEEAAGILARYASPTLVRSIVNMGLEPYATSLGEGVLFRNGLVNLVNGAQYAVDLRYGFDVEGEEMVPAGERGALIARAADVIIANAGGTELCFSRYEVEGAKDFSCFDRSARLGNRGEAALKPGEAMIVRGGRDVASLRDGSGARFLSLCFAPRSAIDWVFDRNTLAPIAQSVAHVDDSELITCLDVAAWLGSEELLGVAEELAKNKAHFVRWRAVQALSRIDPDAARRHVRAATRDTHPSVRAAAQRTLHGS